MIVLSEASMPCTESTTSPVSVKRSSGRMVPTNMNMPAPAIIAAAIRRRSHQIGVSSSAAAELRSRPSATSSCAHLAQPGLRKAVGDTLLQPLRGLDDEGRVERRDTLADRLAAVCHATREMVGRLARALVTAPYWFGPASLLTKREHRCKADRPMTQRERGKPGRLAEIVETLGRQARSCSTTPIGDRDR